MWEKAFQKTLESLPSDPYIEITYFHSQSLAEELKRNADSLVPRFITAFTILIIFSVICSMATIDGTFYVDWVLSKPILAVLGVMNAGMGIATAIGALNLIGVPYNDIVGVMPFLVVAVGVDNMFLMAAAVRRTNRAFPFEVRVGECMSDAAISMFITSLTDAFSFGVGTITRLEFYALFLHYSFFRIPAVQIFCFYTCAAIIFTFIYQVFPYCMTFIYSNIFRSLFSLLGSRFGQNGNPKAFIVFFCDQQFLPLIKNLHHFFIKFSGLVLVVTKILIIFQSISRNRLLHIFFKNGMHLF